MRHWRVEVYIDGDEVLSIESGGWVAGDPNANDFGDEIRACAGNLLGFAGSGDSSCFLCDNKECECDQ